MKKFVISSIVSVSVGVSLLFAFNGSSKARTANNDAQIAAPGMVAYAASYASDPTNEPKFSTQNSKTFQYLNLGNTLDYYRGDSVKVGIIDSGINYDHEDFMVNNSTKVKGDSKYYTYQTSSWVYYGASSHGYSYIDDTLGHGTNVAATVAAAINSVGGTGLAPNVELYVYKVTNSNDGYEFGAIQNALLDAKTLGIDVINMSFQSYEHAVSYGSSSMGASSGCSTILSYYLNQAYNAGITLVGAAGNFNTDEPSYPGSNSHVINVGSLSSDGTDKAPFSNYGSTIDIVAPGYVYVADEATNTAYTNTQGTSFSAPLVTAAIALYKQQNPSATPDEIEAALYASCDYIDDSSSSYTNWAGHGALNVSRFLGTIVNAPTSIVIDNPEVIDQELALEVGDTFDLDWTVHGNGTYSDAVSIYLLEDSGCLSVSNNGHIIALSEGSDYVLIESEADPNVYASVLVTVSASGSSAPTVSSVSVSPSVLNLDLNGTKTGNLAATVSGSNNPEQTVTWTSSNTSVATVSVSGVVTAKAVGNATVTATSTLDTSKSGTCSITVTDSTTHVTGVSLNKSSTTIEQGSSETLVATVSPNNATNKGVTWSSSNTSAATVSNGIVSVPDNATVGATSTITVTTVDGNYSATCVVTVAQDSSSASVSDYNVSTTALTSSGISNNMKVVWGTTSSNVAYSIDNNWVYLTTTVANQIIFKVEVVTNGFKLKYGDSYVYSSGEKKVSLNSSGTVFSLDSSNRVGNSTVGYFVYNSSGLRPYKSAGSYTGAYLYELTPKPKLSSISVSTAPSKTSYVSGEYFDPTNLVITRTYSDSSTSIYAYDGHTEEFGFSPSLTTPLTTSDTSVTISYGGKACEQAINVKQLSSLSISGYATSFVEGDTFSFGGTVTAYYSDSTHEVVTNLVSFSGYNMLSIGNQTVTVSYGNQQTEYGITVTAGTLSSIAVSGQTTSYQINGSFSFDGTCTATFENGYHKVVTPTSVTTPDMTSGGAKVITVLYTYNGNTVSTFYEINVCRTVIETQTTTLSCTYDFSTLSGSSEITSTNPIQECYSSTGGLTGSVTSRTRTYAADGFLRLATGGGSGSVAFSFDTAVTDIVIVAKGWSDSESNCTLSITNGGSVTTTSASQVDTFNVHLTKETTSIALSASTNNRIKIQYLTFKSESTANVDISNSEDCLGLETFISNYMHTDYVENLGYCKDNEHHYYSTAKAAFNSLNTHQRSLFTSNSAYANEWARLSNWASFNGDTLNGSNQLSLAPKTTLINSVNSDGSVAIIVIISIMSLSALGGYIYLKRRKED